MHVPYNILLGPIYLPYQIGDYIHHPQIQTFSMHEKVLKAFYPSDAASQLDFSACDIYLNFDQSLELKLADIFDALPPGWEPDLLIWWGFMFLLPQDIEDCPCPSVLIVADWHAFYLPIMQYLRGFDYILSDRALFNHLKSTGYKNCDYWPAYSFHPPQIPKKVKSEREIDISFIGTLNSNLHRERAHYLLRLARQAAHYSVYLGSKVYLQDYYRVLQNSKIAFNYSIRGEMNLRAYEAAACGALLFMEESNLEIRQFLTPGESCVLYNTDNFETLLEYYLHHPEERQAIAQKGQEIIQNYSFESQFKVLIERLPAILSEIKNRPSQRTLGELSPPDRFLLQIQHTNCSDIEAFHHQAVKKLETQLQQISPTDPQYPRFVNALITCQAQTALEKGNLENYVLPLFKSTDPHPILTHNLACLSCTLQQLPLAYKFFQQSTATLSQTDFQLETLKQFTDFVLPLGYTSLHRFWQWISYALAGNQAELLQAYRQLLLWNNLYLMGLLVLDKDPAWAIQIFQAAIQLYAHFPETYFGLAQAYLQQGQNSQASQCFEQGLERGVIYPGIWLQWLALLIEEQQIQKAKAMLALALVLFQSTEFEAIQPKLKQWGQLLQQLESESQDGFS